MEFLKDVKHEVEMLKLHTTAEEKARLNINEFGAANFFRCIYGLLTGSCATIRAKELMDLACIRVMDTTSGSLDVSNKNVSEIEKLVNGQYEGQTWGEYDDDTEIYVRKFKYLSVLEGYICTKNARVAEIISYIKGETQTLEL